MHTNAYINAYNVYIILGYIRWASLTIQNLPDSFVQIWGLTLQILSKSWEKALESAGNRSNVLTPL